VLGQDVEPNEQGHGQNADERQPIPVIGRRRNRHDERQDWLGGDANHERDLVDSPHRQLEEKERDKDHQRGNGEDPGKRVAVRRCACGWVERQPNERDRDRLLEAGERSWPRSG
jgi:hypothetical protein